MNIETNDSWAAKPLKLAKVLFAKEFIELKPNQRIITLSACEAYRKGERSIEDILLQAQMNAEIDDTFEKCKPSNPLPLQSYNSNDTIHHMANDKGSSKCGEIC